MSGMHSLSDEILLEICGYLSSEDLLSLSQTSIKFNDLLCDRLLIREVNFRAVYSLTNDKLKLFVKPKIRCQNIRTLSLSSCYWLTSADIFWAIRRLDGLENLHVDDTQLSIKHLISLLIFRKKIRSLSWTFNMTNKDKIEDVTTLANNFREMKSLNLFVNYFGVHFLTFLLQHCTSLEELRLSTSSCPETQNRGPCVRNNVAFQLPSLKSLVLNLPEASFSGWSTFIPFLVDACCTTKFWHTLWLHCNRTLWSMCHHIAAFRSYDQYESTFAVSNPLIKDWDLMVMKNIRYFVFEPTYPRNLSLDLGGSRISHLIWKCDLWPESFPRQLQHLCIKCLNFYSCQTSFVTCTLTCEPLLNLRRLSAPALYFLKSSVGVESKTAKGTFSVKGEGRQSHISKEPDKKCLLYQFLHVAPNVQHFELACEGTANCSTYGLPIIEIANLVVIKEWTQLESLFLENMIIVDISPLFQIFSCFPKLRRLSLKNVGMPGTYARSRELGQAIMKLELLEDFRFEHPVVEKLSDLYEALSQKTKIRRIAILCPRTNVKQDIHGVIDIVEKCPLLAFLYILSPSFTQNDCKEFQKSVKTLYKNKHNPLWAKIEGIHSNSIWDTCPTIHYNEMIISNYLSIFPPLLCKAI